MANERCPSCGGAVRAGDPWCTLCWADLRPPPPVVAVAAPVAAAPVAVPVSVGAGSAVDPLTAPLTAVLGEAPPTAAADTPATWPCVECGARNALDADACSVCSAPFGGRINRLQDPKEHRRKMMFYALGAMGAFLTVLALLTFALTDTSGTGGGTPPVDQPIDWSSIPRE